MRIVLGLLILLDSCCEEDRTKVPKAQSPSASAATRPGPGEPVQLATLVGRYEGGRGSSTDRLCIMDGGRALRFGLVVWGSGLHSCSGSGTVDRRGGMLSFRMGGEAPCSFKAQISGKTIVFPEVVPAGCSYYCGAGARLSRAQLRQVGANRAAALEAKDLVGEPLCTEG